VEGDLRFLSHHDCLRAMERLAARARLPVRYTQGFNPRIKMSIASALGSSSSANTLSISRAFVSASDHDRHLKMRLLLDL
jgi:uncharacterized protein (DUF2344 family)